jgi:hypothetical protein
MKMSSRARMVGFGAAIVVLAGCSEAVGPDIDGIEVTLSLSQEEMAVGDTIEIRIVATNTTAGELSFATNACVLVVRILDQSNTPVVYLPGFCNDIRLGHTLGPGESLMRVELFDGTNARSLGAVRRALRSGVWHLRGDRGNILGSAQPVRRCGASHSAVTLG